VGYSCMIYLSRYLDQETANSESVKGPFQSLRVMLPPVTTSLTTQSKGNPIKQLSALSKDTISKLAGLSPH